MNDNEIKLAAPNWRVMGVLNVTPDSFYDGGKYFAAKTSDIEAAVQRTAQMLEEGAAIIDVGGESTRPGAAEVSAEEELRRVVPVVQALIREWPKLVISIDTRKPVVAAAALEAGASILNDVSGLSEEAMVQVVQRFGCEAVMMHMRGTPETMQRNPTYGDVVAELMAFFKARLGLLRDVGIDTRKIIIDPGIGFGKTVRHNLQILRRLREFTELGSPILIGASRKSFIGKLLDLPEAERLEGSLAAALMAYLNGATVLRVHDVGPTVRLLKTAQAIAEIE